MSAVLSLAFENAKERDKYFKKILPAPGEIVMCGGDIHVFSGQSRKWIVYTKPATEETSE